eukprot:Cvel_32756.t1-p1 / transcript=Cvel_32756.t1 / gene=Cvel_32756 / organism=Chromera_velia_CCMP2878 / gene_product=Ankyrin repeat domain-containing protein 13B, putative / transcript_product=Ankyrin repeat domain-containing protein 13B, putative / location=Cvel_scaffold5170:1-4556(-) / protein_length=604 / sequence_SO=supercontig / SO=protein_coding / is_pseudo=false
MQPSTDKLSASQLGGLLPPLSRSSRSMDCPSLETKERKENGEDCTTLPDVSVQIPPSNAFPPSSASSSSNRAFVSPSNCLDGLPYEKKDGGFSGRGGEGFPCADAFQQSNEEEVEEELRFSAAVSEEDRDLSHFLCRLREGKSQQQQAEGIGGRGESGGPLESGGGSDTEAAAPACVAELGSFPLHKAVWLCDAAAVEALVAWRPSVLVEEDQRGWTALNLAVVLASTRASSRSGCVKHHVNSKLDVKGKGGVDSDTIVNLLIRLGADPLRRDSRGWASVDECVSAGDRERGRRLIEWAYEMRSARWTRRIPLLCESLAALPDFYMEIRFEFECSVLPRAFVNALAPHDTVKVWKRGSSLRIDSSLASSSSSWKKNLIRTKKRPSSILFRPFDSDDVSPTEERPPPSFEEGQNRQSTADAAKESTGEKRETGGEGNPSYSPHPRRHASKSTPGGALLHVRHWKQTAVDLLQGPDEEEIEQVVSSAFSADPQKEELVIERVEASETGGPPSLQASSPGSHRHAQGPGGSASHQQEWGSRRNVKLKAHVAMRVQRKGRERVLLSPTFEEHFGVPLPPSKVTPEMEQELRSKLIVVKTPQFCSSGLS